MKGLILFEMHSALNLHFNQKTNYDFFLYHGKTRVNKDTFNRSPFKWQYVGIENKIDHLLWFMYTSYKDSNWKYITPKKLFLQARYWRNKVVHKHPQEFMNNIVKNDLQTLRTIYNGSINIFDVNGLYPNLYNEFKQGTITLESFLLIDSYIKSVCYKDLSQDIVSWPLIIQDLNIARPFVEELFNRLEFNSLFSENYLQ